MLRGSIEPGSNLYVGTYTFHQVIAVCVDTEGYSTRVTQSGTFVHMSMHVQAMRHFSSSTRLKELQLGT